jgi:AraC-like DNA-binding protein
MGAKRYLTLRRLHLAWKALLAASASAATVTELAMRYGFWELSRFAVAYKSSFGEIAVADVASYARMKTGLLYWPS